MAALGSADDRPPPVLTCTFGPRPSRPARFVRHVGAGWLAVGDGGAAPAGALVLAPVAAWGTWDGAAVLGEVHGPTDAIAPLAVLTRTAPARGHRQAVAGLTAELAAALDAGVPGLRWWVALDDHGVPGTLSVWDDAAAASGWACRAATARPCTGRGGRDGWPRRCSPGSPCSPGRGADRPEGEPRGAWRATAAPGRRRRSGRRARLSAQVAASLPAQ